MKLFFKKHNTIKEQAAPQGNATLEEARLSAIIEKSVDKVVKEHRTALEKLGSE